MNLKFIAVLLGMLLATSISTAQSTQNLKLELCTEDTYNCYSSSEVITLAPEEPLILKATIINKEGKWMCWSGLYYKYELHFKDFQGGKKIISGDTGTGYDGKLQNFCFTQASNKENVFYFPLREYNSYGADSFSEPSDLEKKGDWEITDFQFIFKNLAFYDTNSLGKTTTTISSSSDKYEGNNLKFSVVIDEPTKDVGKINNNVFLGAMEFLRWALGGIALVILGIVPFVRKKLKRNLWTTFWIFLLLDLVVWIIVATL